MRIPMIAITTSNSTSVKPLFDLAMALASKKRTATIEDAQTGPGELSPILTSPISIYPCPLNESSNLHPTEIQSDHRLELIWAHNPAQSDSWGDVLIAGPREGTF